MPYTARFIPTDDLIVHLRTLVPTITDPQIVAHYTGFLSVSAVTVFELAIKDIFKEFAIKKNAAFGSFIQKHYERLNGRIKVGELANNVKLYGDRYHKRFKNKIDDIEARHFALHRISIKNSYSNLLTCRHGFVHGGNVSLTIAEVMNNYEVGKHVIHILDQTMKR